MPPLLKRLQRITSNQQYYPEIDGIRFVAIVLVLLFHAYGYFLAKTAAIYPGASSRYKLLDTLLRNGDRGVELFFVLSGFILCLPFAKHYILGEKKVVLKKYFLRRVTRLEPPYIIVMTLLLVLHILMRQHSIQELVGSWGASLIYGHSIIFRRPPLMSVVAWSLEIEIQFYLLAPLFFSVLKLGAGLRRLLLAGAMLLLVLAQHFLPAPEGLLTLYYFGQYFFAGILLADLYVSGYLSGFFKTNSAIFFGVIVVAGVLFLPIMYAPGVVGSNEVLISRLVFPFLIIYFFYLVMKNSHVKRVFSMGWIPIIGGMCYSIYLLHYTLISLLGRLTLKIQITDQFLPNMLLQLVLLIVPAIFISAIYYYLVERPFMAGKWTDGLMNLGKQKNN